MGIPRTGSAPSSAGSATKPASLSAEATGYGKYERWESGQTQVGGQYLTTIADAFGVATTCTCSSTRGCSIA